jgi:flagellar capping protein FliD
MPKTNVEISIKQLNAMCNGEIGRLNQKINNLEGRITRRDKKIEELEQLIRTVFPTPRDVDVIKAVANQLVSVLESANFVNRVNDCDWSR